MKISHLQFFIFNVLFAVGFPFEVSAQSPTPPPPTMKPIVEAPELAQLRQQYLQRAMTSSHTLTDQFTNALLNLERDLAANGNYDQALIAQKRRLALLESYRNAFAECNKNTAHTQPQITAKQVVVTDNVIDFDQFGFDDILLGQNKHP